MTKKQYPQWYKTHGLKHVTGFLTPTEKQRLRMLASAADKSLSRYVTRLLQQHIKDMTALETESGRPQNKPEDGGHSQTKQQDGEGRNRNN